MKKKKKIILDLLTLICIATIIFSSYKIIKWYIDSKQTTKILKDFKEPEIVKDDENTVIIEQEEIEESNPYWDYIKMDLINVDFTELKKTNSDVVGWIKINGTNINYPFVQTKDNDFYLNHSFTKERNSAGWVFLDYRNNINNLNKNTILYAHNRLDKIMFGTLESILTNGWLNNTNNYIIKLSTESENTLWQIFSVYNIKETSDYLKIDFESDEKYNSFLNKIKDRSEYNFNTSLNSNDKILTLSTCHKNDERTVVHAKLIKIQQK